jgi:hypothetical protein
LLYPFSSMISVPRSSKSTLVDSFVTVCPGIRFSSQLRPD